MTTARERMLELSPLGTASARAHFLAITLGSGNGPTVQIFDVMQIGLEMADYDVTMESAHDAELDDDYQVEFDSAGLC